MNSAEVFFVPWSTQTAHYNGISLSPGRVQARPNFVQPFQPPIISCFVDFVLCSWLSFCFLPLFEITKIRPLLNKSKNFGFSCFTKISKSVYKQLVEFRGPPRK